MILGASEEGWCWLGAGFSSSLLVCAGLLSKLTAGLGDEEAPDLGTGLLPPSSAFISFLRSLGPGRKEREREFGGKASVRFVCYPDFCRQ